MRRLSQRSRRVALIRATLGALIALGFGAACTSEVRVGEQLLAGQRDGARPPALDGDSEGAGPVIDAPACVPTTCAGKLYDCGDCVDNDGDGRIDMRDPDCLGPCHNAEDTFFGSIPGQNRAPCTQDCYFDGDSGFGNDGCVWSHVCDPLSVAPDYPPEGPECAYDPQAQLPHQGQPATCESAPDQSDACNEFCGALVPNGCDCFGCCEIPGAPTPVWLGSVDEQGNTCDRGSLADPSRCRPCTQVQSCLNSCESCELCVGKTTLPPECEAPPGSAPPGCAVPDCRSDQQPCGTDCTAPCPAGQTCITGCCITPPE